MLSRQTIQKFQQVWERDCGEKLSDKEASVIAHQLVQYFDMLACVAARKEQDEKRK